MITRMPLMNSSDQARAPLPCPQASQISVTARPGEPDNRWQSAARLAGRRLRRPGLPGC